MIPLLMARHSLLAPSGELVCYFPGRMIVATEIVGAVSIVFTCDIASVDPLDSLSFQVAKIGSPSTQWAQHDFASTTTAQKQSIFTSASAGYDGAGTYQFSVAGRLTGAVPYDVASNSIYLTISA